ncbi:MAG: OmpH family outer membrane protein, partial [Desulfobacteraceae bacterium]|nr:OmpH family outer membrane protein [Desulfobacteraceae bacterium]
QQELEEMDKAFQKEALVLSPEKREEKSRSFRIRVNDFKKMTADFKKELKILDTKIMNRMQKEVFEIAQVVGKEEGYLMIFERKAAGIIYIPDEIDITEKVIKKYNKKIAKTQ